MMIDRDRKCYSWLEAILESLSAMTPNTRHVFLVTLLAYILLMPHFMHSWRRTGDEPHYLAIARSIAYDGDVDLANNYDLIPYRPHVIVQPDGTWRATHGVGLALLIAGPYLVGQEFGVFVLLAILSAMIAANTFALAREATGLLSCGLVAWIIVSFAPPGLFYSFQLYPELPGALIVLWCLRQIQREDISYLRWTSTGLLIGFLPWLVIRFGLLSAWLCLFGFLKIMSGYSRGVVERERLLRLAALFIPLAFLSLLHIWFTYFFYGSTSPLAIYGSPSPLSRSFQTIPYLWLVIGFLLDQRTGLFIFSPLLTVSVGGLIFSIWKGSSTLRIVSITVIAQLISLAPIGGFWVEWSIPTRYLIVVLPLLSISAAVVIVKTRSRAFLIIAAVLTGISILNLVVVFRNQELAYPTRSHSKLLAHHSESVGVDLRKILPQLTDQWVDVVYSSVGDARELDSASVGEVQANRGSEAEAAARTHEGNESSNYPEEPMQLVGRSALQIAPGKTQVRFQIRGLDPDGELGIGGQEASLVVASVDGGEPILVERFLIDAEPNSSPRFFVFQNPVSQRLEMRLYSSSTIRAQNIRTAFLPGASRMYGWDLMFLYAFLIALYSFVGIRGCPGPGSVDGAPTAAARSRPVSTLILALLVAGALYSSWSRVARQAYYAQDLPRRIGTVRWDKRGQWLRLVCGEPGDAGALIHGPYKAHSEGEYEAVFWVLYDAPPGLSVGQIDVHSTHSRQVLAEQVVTASGSSGNLEPYHLPFRLEEMDELEFRVWYYGSHELCVDRVEMVDRSSIVSHTRVSSGR